MAACGSDSPTAPAGPTTTSAPYSQTDLVVGTGAIAATGNTVNVTYAGFLHDSTKAAAKGAQFDSGTINFAIGTGKRHPRLESGRGRHARRRTAAARDSAGACLRQRLDGPSNDPPNDTLVFDVS